MPWNVIIPLGVPVLALIGVIVTVRGGRAGSIDTREAAERKRQDDRITKLETDLSDERDARRDLEDYVYELREHIAEEKGPPPPGWPERLRRA